MTIWREFFEEDDGRGSASRLNMIIGVVIGSIIVLMLAIRDKLETEMFAVYLLATGGVYGIGKWRESSVAIEETRASAPPVAPVQNVIVPPAPVVQVNSPPGDGRAKDMNVQVEGEMNVSKS